MAMIDERGLDGHTIDDLDIEAFEAAGPFPGPGPVIPVPGPGNGFPPVQVIPFSGLYKPQLIKPGALTGELRIDVDGHFPQMTASGNLRSGLISAGHWIAKLTATGPGAWTGGIYFKNGSTGLIPHTKVTITAVKAKHATVTFSGGGAVDRVMTFPWASTAFHDVGLEFDSVAGTSAVTTVDTGDHPNHPGGLADEVLSIETVYRRAGFKVTKSAGDSVVPIAGAGVGARWSDMEMHDAMQSHWSQFANKAQWSMWTLFASLHEQGTSLGGIMFDDIGPHHRQGTAIFEDAFIANAPAGDLNPVAWVRRMRFWTAVHEIGHAFNLAHSWQKALVDNGHGPWINLANEPEARSFMNYPYNVAGGQSAFFANFGFRFSDNELLFLRHAPGRFVQQGNAIWFDHHGFEQAAVSPEPALQLELRVHRPGNAFAFLEPVDVELKLTNVSDEPVLVPSTCLTDTDGMTIVVKRQRDDARQQRSFAHLCLKSIKVVLAPGQSMYGSVPVSAGLDGWNIDEPGRYLVQMALHLDDEDLVSNPMTLTVEPPMARAEEKLAQDFFSDDVARVLTFGGTQVLTAANDVLEEVAVKLAGRAPARHAQVALGRPYTIDYKLIVPDFSEGLSGAAAEGIDGAPTARIEVQAADPARAKAYLDRALLEEPEAAAEALGHIRYKEEVDRFADTQAEQGDPGAAADTLATLQQTLEVRNVKPSVVAEVAAKQAAYARALR
jgi:hypothetical protein